MSGIINFKCDCCMASNAAFSWIAAELLERLERVQENHLSVQTKNAFAMAAAEKTGDLDLSVASAVELKAIRACLEGFITEVHSGEYPFFDVSFRPAYIDLLMEVWELLDRDLKAKGSPPNAD